MVICGRQVTVRRASGIKGGVLTAASPTCNKYFERLSCGHLMRNCKVSQVS